MTRQRDGLEGRRAVNSESSFFVTTARASGYSLTRDGLARRSTGHALDVRYARFVRDSRARKRRVAGSPMDATLDGCHEKNAREIGSRST